MNKNRAAALAFCFIAAFTFSLPASAQEKRQALPELTRTALLNGLQLYVASTPYLGDTMTVGLLLRYGATFDPASKGGEAYLVSQVLGKATIDLTAKDIQDELNYLNAALEVHCDWDGIRLLLRGRSAAYERLLLLLYRISCEAKFNDEDFTRAQNALLEQLSAPEDVRQRVRTQFDSQLFRSTTYGRPLRGSIATVRNITVGDLRFFYKKFFSPDQAALAVVGSAPVIEIQRKARRIWGVWVKVDETPFTFLPAPKPAALNIFLDDDASSPAAQYILGNLWPNREEPQYYACLLATRLLQDQLTKALPASRLTVASEGRRLPGPFFVQGQAAADQAVEEIKKVMDVVEAFKEADVKPADLSGAQDHLVQEFTEGFGTTDGICNALLDAELYRLGINYLSTVPEFIRRANPQAIKDAAKQWFFPGGLVLVVRGPASILRPQLESLGTVQLLKR
jgi:zinc protease